MKPIFKPTSISSGKWHEKSVSISQTQKNRQQANLLPLLSPSPICDIDRTFTNIFYLKPKNSHTKSVNHLYQNPVYLAKQYRNMIDSGEMKNQSDLALKLGTSKVHVCRVLSLLRLNTALIEAVEKIGNPMPARIVTVRMLRECQNSPALYKALLNRLRKSKK